MQIVKLARRGNSMMIVIPRAYMQQLNWSPGDKLVLEIEGDELRAWVLTPWLSRKLRDERETEAARAEAQG